MSINYFLNKIKGSINVDKVTIMYSLVIIGVGISAFGLGRISVQNNLSKDDNLGITITQNNELASASLSTNSNTSNIIQSGKNYVASKNGKLYYTPTCAGAKRIAQKNEVWFNTAVEAEKSGYTLSTSCK
ncbi:MAG TPA: hypothetical protein VMR49_00400 [Candidatus Paceibacterota bacterium]|nr:hypothetical protein [Candidatus Paceibacterota bacterium]